MKTHFDVQVSTHGFLCDLQGFTLCHLLCFQKWSLWDGWGDSVYSVFRAWWAAPMVIGGASHAKPKDDGVDCAPLL